MSDMNLMICYLFQLNFYMSRDQPYQSIYQPRSGVLQHSVIVILTILKRVFFVFESFIFIDGLAEVLGLPRHGLGASDAVTLEEYIHAKINIRGTHSR
jgi:hypothetical protein